MMQLRQRQPRETDAKFLAFIRTLPCCVCGRSPVHAAHIRSGSKEYNKRPTGLGERASDCWALPVCLYCHMDDNDSIHRAGEAIFWQRIGIDPFALAIRLYADFKGEKP